MVVGPFADTAATSLAKYPNVPLGNDAGGVDADGQLVLDVCGEPRTWVVVPTITLDEAFSQGAAAAAEVTGPVLPRVSQQGSRRCPCHSWTFYFSIPMDLALTPVDLIVFDLSRRLDIVILDLMGLNGYQCAHFVGQDVQGMLEPIVGGCWRPKLGDLKGRYYSACFNMRR